MGSEIFRLVRLSDSMLAMPLSNDHEDSCGNDGRAAPAAAPMPMPAFAPTERLSLDAAEPPALSLDADGVAVADDVLEWLVGIGAGAPFGAPAEVDAAVVCALLGVGMRLELVTKLELGVAGCCTC